MGASRAINDVTSSAKGGSSGDISEFAPLARAVVPDGSVFAKKTWPQSHFAFLACTRVAHAGHVFVGAGFFAGDSAL